MSSISVVGSINLDLVVSASRLPRPGETLTDGAFAQHPGGKGANQALAARRLGSDVRLIARVGADTNRELALSLLQAEGVDLGGVTVDPELPTGVAVIIVAANGENQIVVAPGANRSLSADDVSVAGADAVICQLEIPDEGVIAAAEQATGLFCLNAAPARMVPRELLDRADVVIVNETEWLALEHVLVSGNALVLVTQGADGAIALKRGSELAREGSPTVDVVDTVGAGDAFVAAFTTAFVEGQSLERSLATACVAGALATTRPGAQPSLPTREAVAALGGF